jgi:Outer membrane protein beta-barrel domain
MKRISILSAICLSFLLPSAHAQLGIYAGFTASNTNLPNENWFYGPTFGAYYNVVKLPVIKLGIDGRASILNGSGSPSSQQIVNGLAGPRLEVQLPLIPLKPYVEGYAGGSKVEIGQGTSRSDKTVLGYGFSAGADLTIFPRLDWRVAEYSYTRSSVFGNVTQNTVTTGLVLRLPIP